MRNLPIAFKYSPCTIGIIVADDYRDGFFTSNMSLNGRNQVSVKWNSFWYVSGLIIYGTNTKVGIGIVRNNTYIMTFASIRFDEIYGLSDIVDGSSLITNVSISLKGDRAIISTVTNYGQNIIEATISIDISDTILSAPIEFLHPLNDSITVFDVEELEGSGNGDGFEVMWTSILDSSDHKEINSQTVERHKIGVLVNSGYSIDEDISDLLVLEHLSVKYVVVTTSSEMIIYSYIADVLEEVSRLPFDIQLTGEHNDSFRRDNFMSRKLVAIPKCSENFTSQYHTTRLDHGVFRKFKEYSSIMFQYYWDGKIVGITVDIVSTDSGTTFSVNSSSRLVKAGTREEEDFIMFTDKIKYNETDMMYSFLGNTASSPMNRLSNQSEDSTTVFSISPYIEYQ